MQNKIVALLLFTLSISCRNNNEQQVHVLPIHKPAVYYDLSSISDRNYSVDSIVNNTNKYCNVDKRLALYYHIPLAWNKLTKEQNYNLASYNDSIFLPVYTYDPHLLNKCNGNSYVYKEKNNYYQLLFMRISHDLNNLNQRFTIKELDSIEGSIDMYRNRHNFILTKGFKGKILSDTVMHLNDSTIYSVFEVTLSKNMRSYYKRNISISFLNNIKVIAAYSALYTSEKELIEKSWEARKLMENIKLVSR